MTNSAIILFIFGLVSHNDTDRFDQVSIEHIPISQKSETLKSRQV